MRILTFFLTLLFLPIHGFSTFLEPHTGLSFEVPLGYVYDREESMPENKECSWWYCFVDSNGNQLSLEIEAYDHPPTLIEHFLNNMTSGKKEEEGEEIILDRLQFDEFELNGREYTQCQVRILSFHEETIEPFYISDCLFVKGQYGYTLTLLKKEDAEWHELELNTFIHTILESIQFHE